MEMYNNTPETHPAKDWIFGRVKKRIGSVRPNPIQMDLFRIVITVLVDLHAPHTSSLHPIGSVNRSKCKIERIH